MTQSRGLVPSLSRPGGNLTGVSTFIPDLVGKRLELFRELVPKATRVAILGHGADPAVGRAFLEAERACAVLRLAVDAYKVREFTDLEPVLAAIAKSRPDGLLVLQNSGHLAVSRRRRNRALSGLIVSGSRPKHGQSCWRA